MEHPFKIRKQTLATGNRSGESDGLDNNSNFNSLQFGFLSMTSFVSLQVNVTPHPLLMAKFSSQILNTQSFHIFRILTEHREFVVFNGEELLQDFSCQCSEFEWYFAHQTVKCLIKIRKSKFSHRFENNK